MLKNLFERQFTFLDEREKSVRSRWVQQVTRLENESAIEIIFTIAVVNEITRINGIENFLLSI